jgi:glycosyltransferase involved in cell wall biosynthesis
MMLGLRSPVGGQGGIEAHVRELALSVVSYQGSVEVLCRAPYHPQGSQTLASGVTMRRLWSPRTKNLEAIAHTLIGVMFAAVRRPAVLHIHGVGPALLAPLARALGLKVVFTHHGRDYEREKWGPIAKAALRLGEAAGFRFSNATICIAKQVSSDARDRFGCKVHFIPNGAAPVSHTDDETVLNELGLTKGRYILNVGRLVPEKRQLDLIRAMKLVPDMNARLVLAGGADHESSYSRAIKKEADADQRVILAGQVFGSRLSALYRNACLFALPSSHEGLPIALLEALTYRLPVLLSNIPALLDLELPSESYVPLGDEDALAVKIRDFCAESSPRQVDWSQVLSRYQWPSIALQTSRVYKRVNGMHFEAGSTNCDAAEQGA